MTESYNKYFSRHNTDYQSTIAFINTNNTVLMKDLFFVEFKDNSKFKNNFYLSDENLRKMFLQIRTRNMQFQDAYIKNISYIKKYYSYVKIIEDEYNPQLEGKVLLMSYGVSIKNRIDLYFDCHTNFKNTFRFVKKTHQTFPDFVESFFTSEELEINDSNLDIDSEIRYIKYDPIKVERKEKLQKLSQIIE